jgi:hypothetical protein
MSNVWYHAVALRIWRTVLYLMRGCVSPSRPVEVQREYINNSIKGWPLRWEAAARGLDVKLGHQTAVGSCPSIKGGARIF